ncbi:glutamate synthase [Siculibacillus lacustris]|uniref:Glutamate synthase n=1 Tax=Siculibacillus lacustris TaxID=1549641 RepID=A0A4Q9VW05_9HYPH|nr:4Fe-4S dicluster domain-containing protein [Siculibacillus lacustris]TBW40040.1 glutamate synthase [Siculibacillus lacustris]
MSDLFPVPFATLVDRMIRELAVKKAVYDLRRWNFFQADPAVDLSLDIHGRRAATPFGPAAGPHTQLAPNIVLAWLAGARVIELKTVQVIDDLDIARPCIDMGGGAVGWNIEWSQELGLVQSLEEYVKAAMLIEIARAEGLAPGLDATVFDMSVGYDLAGIRSPAVRAFLDGMKDARAIVEKLRAEIPDAHARLRDLAFPTALASSVTLSTFHGCPPQEIEAIAAHLMTEVGLDVVVKLNPTLLGKTDLEAILHDRLGFTDVEVPPETFETDATWAEVTGIVERLGALAERAGRRFGVKFTNTLLVRNVRDFFPAGTPVAYLSGRPLHVLAIELVRRFRDQFGDRFPVSFSAGIDAENFADAVALGLKPVSVCSDLLIGNGYAKGADYLAALVARMKGLGADDLEVFALKAFGAADEALAGLDLAPERAAACRAALAGGDPRAAAGAAFGAWVSAALILNSRRHADRVLDDPRYRRDATVVPIESSGATLGLLDCEMCGHCVTVCPNAAVFRFDLPPEAIPLDRLVSGRYAVHIERVGELAVARRQQIGIFADLCNACGNCTVACPEIGAPHEVKPVFFGGRAAWDGQPNRDGLLIERIPEGLRILGRTAGDAVTVERRDDGSLRYAGEGFDLTFPSIDGLLDASGSTIGPVDLGRMRQMLALTDAVTAPKSLNWVSVALS